MARDETRLVDLLTGEEYSDKPGLETPTPSGHSSAGGPTGAQDSIRPTSPIQDGEPENEQPGEEVHHEFQDGWQASFAQYPEVDANEENLEPR